MAHFQVIVVGAGVGGLSAAALLCKVGIRTLVLEQTPFPGGRCYSRVVDDAEYDIGALYVGSRALDILKDVFGIDCAFEPFRIGIKIGSSMVSVPLDLRTLQELHQCGVPYWDILHLLTKVPKLYWRPYFRCRQSVGEVLDSLTDNAILRRIGYVLFGASGVSPYRLPSHYLRMDRAASGTRIGNPVHFHGGNKQIADLLSTFIVTRKGDLVFQEHVKRICFDRGRVCGVATDRDTYDADFVISNADVHTTTMQLCGPELWSDPYLQMIGSLQQPLELVCVFLTIDPSQVFPTGFGVFFVPGESVDQEFDQLEAGRFPEHSTFCLQVPTNVEQTNEGPHRATLQFYYPRGGSGTEALQRQVRRVMTDGLERLLPGLSGRVICYSVYDPARYEREFGLRPVVFGVSPDVSYQRLPAQTPVPNLFCVGDSVQPERPSVPQAMESGIACAREVIGRIDDDEV